MELVTMLIILSALSLVFALSYVFKPFRRIKLYNSINLVQIINLIGPSTLFIIFFVYSYIEIIKNPRVLLASGFDSIILIILFLFSSFSLLGVGIHFTGKCIREHLNKKYDKELLRLDYLLHMFLGHHIVFILGMLSLALMAFFQFFHPSVLSVSSNEAGLILVFSFIWALTWTYTIVFARISRTIYLIVGWLSFLLLSLFYYFFQNTPIFNLPYTLFFASTIFFISLLILIVRLLEIFKKETIGMILFKSQVNKWQMEEQAKSF